MKLSECLSAGAGNEGVDMTQVDALECLDESCEVLDAMEKMAGAGMRTMPVVDSAGNIKGVVSFGHLLNSVVERLSHLVDEAAPVTAA